MNYKKALKEIITTIVVAEIAAFLIVRFLYMPVSVSGSSMMNTLYDKDRGFVSIINRNLTGVKRFDIVVVDRNNEKYLLKRVIGLPGEVIESRDNQLYIDGVAYSEDFLSEGTITDDYAIQLNDNEYLVLGDHREVSNDSRSFGPITLEDIRAKNILIVYPFAHFGIKH